MTNHLQRFSHFVSLGNSGSKEDVDKLMDTLFIKDDLATKKLVDYALSLVRTKKGIKRIRYYLFKGSPIQRNYAALYFRRNGNTNLLKRALRKRLIDWDQGFAT